MRRVWISIRVDRYWLGVWPLRPQVKTGADLEHGAFGFMIGVSD